MKNIKVLYSKTSKRGTSINFNFQGQNYSVKKSLLKSLEIPSLEGKIISINNYRISSSWVMIEDLEIINDKSIIRSINQTNFVNKNNIYEIDDYPSNNKILDEFSPLETMDNRFYLNEKNSYKVTDVFKIEKIDEAKNHYASVLANIFTRSKNPNYLLNINVDTVLILLILEAYKRNYKKENIEISIPSLKSITIEDSLNELKALIKIFDKISSEFPGSEIIDFIDNITIKNNKLEKWQLISNHVVLELSIVKTDIPDDPPSFIAKNSIKYSNLVKYKKYINNLLKLIFYNNKTKIEYLKNEQLVALNLLMNGQENVLAVLKTGFGKSLIYQFVSMLQPRIFLNIFPIKSLISDQTISLESDFGLCYIIENEKLRKLGNPIIYQKLLSYKRMFMVTPERLENQLMQKYFENLDSMIGYMVFDEAHCISEWGHDFRPSYLMARHLMENIKNHGRLNVIALTATAAPHIQKDIATLLSIKKENIVNIADQSGLERKEITYKIRKCIVDDFDNLNRSEKYSNIIDKYINNSFQNSKQAIAFFIKSGSIYDLYKDKNTGDPQFKTKINAFSTFKRLNDKSQFALYTGKNKSIGNDNKPNFNEFQKQKYIIATKSFGMGINLSDCDYVLLAEPPYSLEDLYQQSGRVGRMGQESVVEILFHDNSLIDPLSRLSPYNFFLNINQNRKLLQMEFVEKLAYILINQNKPIEISVKKLYKNNYRENQTYLKWAISHLITEFKLINKYYVVYGANFFIYKIGIYPNKMTEKDFLSIINNKNYNLGLESNSKNIFDGLAIYYKYYFKKLQNDKIIGINILIEKLKQINNNSENTGKLVIDALTQYYKTRIDKVDQLAINVFKLINDKKSFNYIQDYIKNNIIGIDKFELMESISRYKINSNYIEIASLIIHYLFNEKILVSNLENILFKVYELEYLNEIRNNIIYLKYFKNKIINSNELGIKQKIIKLNNWDKVNELTTKINILKGIKYE